MKKREHVDMRLLFIQLQTCCVYPAPPPPAPPATPPSPNPLLPALRPQCQTQDVRESCIFWRTHPPLSLPSVFLWLRPSDQKKKEITPSLVVSLPAETHSSLAAGAEDSSLDSSPRECWDGDARRLPSSHHTQQLHRMTNDCEGRGGATQH